MAFIKEINIHILVAGPGEQIFIEHVHGLFLGHRARLAATVQVPHTLQSVVYKLNSFDKLSMSFMMPFCTYANTVCI